MEYAQFQTELKNYVLKEAKWGIDEKHYEFYPDGFTADGDMTALDFIRNTNIKYHRTESDTLIGDFIVLKKEKENGEMTCRFELKYLYGEFEADGWDRIHAIIDENLTMADQASVSDVMGHLTEYDAIKDKLIIRPINFTDNRYEMKNVIYKQYGDMALVLYVILYDNELGLGTSKIQKVVFEGWGRDVDEVWDNAMVNTNIMAPPRLYINPSDTVNPPYERGAFMAMNSKINHISKIQAPTITTTRQRNGAIAFFYPGVKERLAELMGGSYYLAFTSVDDIHIHHVGSIAPRQILDSLKNVNRHSAPADILSRKVYLYDAGKKELKMLAL